MNVINWLLIVVSVLVVATRLSIKYKVSTLGIDDVLILFALAFSIAFCIALSFATADGLGQPQSSLSSSQLLGWQKATFVTNLMYILVLFLSKLSVVFFLDTMTPNQSSNRIRLGLGALVICWGISSFFAASFQCRAPETWLILSDQCFNQNAFWTYHAISNLILEALLIILPIVVISRLQMDMKRKLSVMACFGARVFAIGAIVCQLVYIRLEAGSKDRTFDTWPTAIIDTFVQSLCIITSCVPYIKTFLLAIQSGMIRSDDMRRHGTGIPGTYGSSVTKVKGTKGSLGSSGKNSHSSIALRSISVSRSWNVLTAESPDERQETKVNWDRDSQASESRMIENTVA